MWNKIVEFLKAPVFPGDEEKTRRASALNALHLNMGGGMLLLGVLGLLFFFAEKTMTSMILAAGFLVVVIGMFLNRRGQVKASGIFMIVFLWSLTVLMALLSGGMRSLDILFFVSGTVIAGIIVGASGALFYAGASLLIGLGFVAAGNAGLEFPQYFTFPPVSAWVILFINLVFTVVPLQAALQSLADSAARARLSEERYRLIASIMSDYAFSVQYGADGRIADEWLSGAFETITGFAPEEYFARGGWVSILHPDDKKQDGQDMMQLRANQKVITEVRVIRKDGNIRWVRSYGHPIWDEKRNQLAGIYGAVQDITDRKQVELSLRQRADEMALLNQITMAITSGDDLYHALRALVRELGRVMTVDAFHIGLYDEQTDIFSYSLFINLDKDLQIPPRKLNENPGLTQEVIAGRRTLYVQDILDPETQRQHNIVIVVDAGMRAYIGIPLLLQDHVIGVMSVQSIQPGAYTPNQIRLLETLAGQVAITIDKAQLMEKLKQELLERQKIETSLRQRETVLEAVAISAERLFAAPEWSTVINDVLEQVGSSINASHAYLFENRKLEGGQIVTNIKFEWTAPNIPSDLGTPIYTEKYLSPDDLKSWYQNMNQGLPFIGDEKSLNEEDYRNLVSREILALLDVPIYIDNQWWGIIGFDDMAHAREWTNAEVDALKIAANVLGAAIKRQIDETVLQNELEQRKALIAELKLKNAESETLRETTTIVASTLDISEAIHRILEQLKRMVYYDSASVWLYNGSEAAMVGSDGLSPDALLPGKYDLDNKQPDYPLRADHAPYILLNDIQEIFKQFQTPALNYIHSWMAIPLWARGTLTGFISLDGRAVGQFTEHDAQMALTYANQVSIALENARLISDLQTELEERRKLVAELKLKNEESDTLRESTAIVAATLEQSEAVDRILEQLARVIHYDSASVQLLRGAMLEIVSFREPGLNRNDVGMQFEVNESDPAYQVIQGALPYTLFEDVQVSTSVFTESPHNNIHSWMAVPLKVKGRIIGVIALDGQRPSQFTERDAQLAITYANQVAIALENARLFSELQEKFAERQMLIEELEHKNAELERFTYTVSHDQRSPLVTIRGFLGYLEKDASTGNMESFQKDMLRIVNATDRMDNLLKDLLELSRVGRLINKPQQILFGDLVNEAVEIVHGRLEKNNITLQTEPNLPLVNVDKLRLIEVLQNLIDNAAKYMGAQKNPVIEIGAIGLDASSDPTFFVRDNGVGIAPEYHDRIFGLFNKLDAASDGTGIGLTLVKRIIEFHAGRIWVESEVGKGSIFYFTLPRADDRDG